MQEWYTWSSLDPTTYEWVAYEEGVSREIEEAHARGEERVSIMLGGTTCTIVFSEMKQYSGPGASREVLRKVPTN